MCKEYCSKREIFAVFPIHGHKANHLANATSFLKDNNISLLNCRGQSYDNAANMSRHYSGLQATRKEQNKYALYVPRAVHSINLVRNLNVKTDFDFVQNFYNLFSSSTYRW
jgi:hypothetical protein